MKKISKNKLILTMIFMGMGISYAQGGFRLAIQEYTQMNSTVSLEDLNSIMKNVLKERTLSDIAKYIVNKIPRIQFSDKSNLSSDQAFPDHTKNSLCAKHLMENALKQISVIMSLGSLSDEMTIQTRETLQKLPSKLQMQDDEKIENFENFPNKLMEFDMAASSSRFSNDLVSNKYTLNLFAQQAFHICEYPDANNQDKPILKKTLENFTKMHNHVNKISASDNQKISADHTNGFQNTKPLIQGRKDVQYATESLQHFLTISYAKEFLLENSIINKFQKFVQYIDLIFAPKQDPVGDFVNSFTSWNLQEKELISKILNEKINLIKKSNESDKLNSVFLGKEFNKSLKEYQRKYNQSTSMRDFVHRTQEQLNQIKEECKSLKLENANLTKEINQLKNPADDNLTKLKTMSNDQ